MNIFWRRRVPLDPPSWDVPPSRPPMPDPPHGEPSRHLVPLPTPPEPPDMPTPHCNGQHGTTGICDWCDALAAWAARQRLFEQQVADRLYRIEVYLGIRRDGGAR